MVTFRSFLELKIYIVTESSGQITSVDNLYTTLTTGSPAAYADSTALNAATVKITDDCKILTLDGIIYYKNSGSASPFYTKSAQSALFTANVVYDVTKTFAYDSGKIYKWSDTTNDYAQVITGITGIKTSRELLVSDDGKKVVLFSK